jgi:hypothetical protein
LDREKLRKQQEWQLVDLCCALAMHESAQLRHRIPVRAKEWEWVPNATRLALPELARRYGDAIPKSIVTTEATVDVRAAAIRDLTPLARQIVPTHDQAVAFYRWFETITEIQAGGDLGLDHVAVHEGVRKTLRSMPFALQKLQTEVEQHAKPYFVNHGDRGGWTQLSMIIDWTFFIHIWQLLDQQGAHADEIVRALTALRPDLPLLSMTDIGALAEDH